MAPKKQVEFQDTPDASQLRLSLSDESLIARLVAIASESNGSVDHIGRSSEVIDKQQQQSQEQEQAGSADGVIRSSSHYRLSRKESIVSSNASVASTSGPLADASSLDKPMVVVVDHKHHDSFSSGLLSHGACLQITSSIASALNMDDYWSNLSSQINVDWYSSVIRYCAAHEFCALKTQHVLNWLCRFRQLVERRCVRTDTASASATAAKEQEEEEAATRQKRIASYSTEQMTTANETKPQGERRSVVILGTSSNKAGESAPGSSTHVTLSEADYVATLHDALQSFVQEELEKNDNWTRLTREYGSRASATASGGCPTNLSSSGGGGGGGGGAAAAAAAAASGGGGLGALSSNSGSATSSVAAGRAGEQRGRGGGLGEKLSKQQLQQQMREEAEEEQRRQAILAALPSENMYLHETDVADWVNALVVRDLLQHAALYRYVAHHPRVCSSVRATNRRARAHTSLVPLCENSHTHRNSPPRLSESVSHFAVMVEQAMVVPPLSRATMITVVPEVGGQAEMTAPVGTSGGTFQEKAHAHRQGSTAMRRPSAGSDGGAGVGAATHAHMNNTNTNSMHTWNASASARRTAHTAALQGGSGSGGGSPTASHAHIHSRRTSASTLATQELSAGHALNRPGQRPSEEVVGAGVAALRAMQQAEMSVLVNAHRETVALEQQRTKAAEDEKALQLHFAKEGLRRAAEDVYHALEQNVNERQMRIIHRLEALERSLGIVDPATLLMDPEEDAARGGRAAAEDKRAAGHGDAGGGSGSVKNRNKKSNAASRN